MNEAAWPTTQTPVELDDRGHVAIDLPCCECQYNLRGLAPDASCPECGQAAVESVHRWIHRNDWSELWVGQTLVGFTMLAGGVAGMLLSFILTVLFGPDRLISTFVATLVVISLGAAIYGFVLATRQDSHRPDTTTTWRSLSRSFWSGYALAIFVAAVAVRWHADWAGTITVCIVTITTSAILTAVLMHARHILFHYQRRWLARIVLVPVIIIVAEGGTLVALRYLTHMDWIDWSAGESAEWWAVCGLIVAGVGSIAAFLSVVTTLRQQSQ